jgi:hypothetical protein
MVVRRPMAMIVIVRVALVMSMTDGAIVVMMMTRPAVIMSVSSARDCRQRRFLQPELRRRDAGTQHAVGRYRAVLDREAAERAAQSVERQPQIEERPEDHVARRAGKTIEISNPGHRQMYLSSFILQ